MAAREAVQITATALATNLQTKLDALAVEAGESAPTVADFRDIFSDTDPEGRDWPRVLTMLDAFGDEAEFEAFSKYDIAVPLVVQYQTQDRDSARARATASYALRGIMQTLNDVTMGQTRNSVTFLQYLRPRMTIGVDDKGYVAMDLRFVARMRDEAP